MLACFALPLLSLLGFALLCFALLACLLARSFAFRLAVCLLAWGVPFAKQAKLALHHFFLVSGVGVPPQVSFKSVRVCLPIGLGQLSGGICSCWHGAWCFYNDLDAIAAQIRKQPQTLQLQCRTCFRVPVAEKKVQDQRSWPQWLKHAPRMPESAQTPPPHFQC